MRNDARKGWKIMKRALTVLLALVSIFSLITLTSCGKNDGTPEDMQLVKGGESDGYYFYGPEEWVIGNIGNIACTYASKIDTSSMTFAKGEKPVGTVEEYFESEKALLPYTNVNVTVNGEDCTFGNTVGKKYVYSYDYKTSKEGEPFSYTTMQIFVSYGDDFYIFTYTASNSERSDEKSYYEFYLDKVSAVIENFKFTAKTTGEGESAEYERDSDGYILVSDKTVAGFKMYVPDTYTLDHSSAMVSVTHADGTNINTSILTYSSVSFIEYWQARIDNINAFANGTCKGVRPLDKDGIETVSLKGTNTAKAYEYTYTLDGVDYHVYQVIIIESGVNGYVFTYTATEENYEKHLSEAKTVLGKITY